MASLAVSLGLAIRRRRIAAGLTQEELADRASLHATYVSLVERAKNNVTVQALDRIASGLGVAPSAILSEAERSRARPAR